MAVPGSPLDPRHRGTNQLLRDGAHLVETAADVLAVLAPLLRHAERAGARPSGSGARGARAGSAGQAAGASSPGRRAGRQVARRSGRRRWRLTN